MTELNGEKLMDLMEWGSPKYWMNGRGRDLKSGSIIPVTDENGGKQWMPVLDEKSGEWYLGIEWEEPSGCC